MWTEATIRTARMLQWKSHTELAMKALKGGKTPGLNGITIC